MTWPNFGFVFEELLKFPEDAKNKNNEFSWSTATDH